MISRALRPSVLIIVCLLCVVVSTPAQKAASANGHPSIAPDEYRQRRALLMSKMEPGSIALFKAKDPSIRSNDVNYLYRQESNFLYLTGCNEPRAYLLLCPEGLQIDSVTTVKEVLFIRPKTRSAAGESMGFEGAKEKLGFSVALPSGDMPAFVKRTLEGKKILYYPPSIPDLAYDPLLEKRTIISREVKSELQSAFPGLEIKNLSSALAELRSVKSPAEIALLQKAIDATAIADIEAMKSCEPGMYEYELQAVIEYCFARNGAEYPGFPSIVGSGPNSCILHYEANRRQMRDGDVVVMDIGAEYSGYTADITRTIPVNGSFTKPQREIYEIVLKAQLESIKEFKPGAMMAAPNAKATEVIAEGLQRLGIIKDKEEVRQYYMHGLSHHVGLDVHDVGQYGKPFQPGMVLTVEPGIYIREGSPCDKQYWNIGIRIEDDVLITESGNQVLTAAAPKTVGDIEALMKKKGLGNSDVGVH